jgi:hypothetical protein
VAALVAAALLVLWIPAARAGLPAVYRPTHVEKIGKGVKHTTLVRSGPNEVVNVARIARGAPYELRAIPAMNAIGNGLERTSSICIRVRCALAVNGDFWQPGTDTPIGGVVSLGRLLRNPVGGHEQVTLSPDGGILAGPLKIHASLVPDDLHALDIAAVNRQPKADELVLFTPASGRSTGTPKGTIELSLRAIEPKGFVTLARTTVVKLAKYGSPAGNAPIPKDGGVLSGTGRGGRLLRDLLARVRNGETSQDALLRIESHPGALESIGGGPVLMRGGRVLAQAAPTAFVRGRHPRTMIGWTPKGEVLLVTVDGRQPGYSDGITLAEGARLMAALGASDAVNLDGGGSTTFVSRGRVVNRPSDRAVRTVRGVQIVHLLRPGQPTLGNVERPIAIALALVPKDPKAVTFGPDVLRDLQLPRTLDVQSLQASDPASDPTGGLPAYALTTASDDRPLRAAAIALSALVIALFAAWMGYRHGARRAVRAS